MKCVCAVVDECVSLRVRVGRSNASDASLLKFRRPSVVIFMDQEFTLWKRLCLNDI